MLTKLLVAINVVAFIWERLTGALNTNQSLLDHGATYGLAVQAGDWWRIITGGFLHGSEMHIAFNMIALWQVGSLIELIYGTPRMAFIYFAALIGSGLAVTYVTPAALTIGASGAVFGLFGAMLMAGIRLGEPGRAMMKQTSGIILINLVLGFILPDISVAAHIGGLLTGIVFGFLLFRPRVAIRRTEPAMAYARPIDPRSDPGVVTIEHPPLDDSSQRP